MTHEPVPEHAPDQPVNVEPPAGAAVSVTWKPRLYVCEQSEPQSTPVPVTVPVPAPDLVTVRVCKTVGGGVNGSGNGTTWPSKMVPLPGCWLTVTGALATTLAPAATKRNSNVPTGTVNVSAAEVSPRRGAVLVPFRYF